MDPRVSARSRVNRLQLGNPFLLGLSGQVTVPPVTTEGRTEGGTSSPASTPGKAPDARRRSIYVGIGVAIIVVMVILAYFLTNGFHSAGGSSGTQGTVLVPRGTSYSMVIGQFNGINFHVNSSAKIQGEVNSSQGIQVYLLTPSEFQYLAKNLTVGQYVWTSGVVANQVVDELDISVQPGQWVLSFVNPNSNFPTGVTFYTNLTLTPD